MATKLKNLKITKVDFVDEGANPDADIPLFKRRETEPEAGTEPELEKEAPKGIFKRLAELFNQYADEPMPVMQKGGASTFDTELNRGKAMDELWEMHYALADSICSIISDTELTSSEKQAAMEQSVDEFNAVIREAIKSWTEGKLSGFVAKTKDTEVNPLVLDTMRSTVDRLSENVTKSTQNAGEDPDNTIIKEGDADMKFDKSKMTPAERAMLEQFEKNYGMEEAGDPTNQPEGVEKKTDAPAATAPAAAPAPAAQQTTDDGDVFKGMSPEVKAEFEALRKFREDTEDAALHAVAKSYELIGKKEEELFPVLKSLKKTNQAAYDQMVAALDDAKAAVEKSGAFAEIGKSGTGAPAQGGVEKEVEAKAAELMKSKHGLTRAQAIDEVLQADPALAKRYEEED